MWPAGKGQGKEEAVDDLDQGVVGTAVLAMILSTQLHTHQAAGLAGQATAFGNTFWWSLGFTAVAIVPALALPHQRKGPIQHEPEQHPIPSHPQE